MSDTISEDEFDRLLGGIERSAFRLEAQDEYALGYERADFERFLAGAPISPPEVPWWRPWLDQIARLTPEGKHVRRVRVLAEPPSDYQRWELWATPWHTRAGERIDYLPRSLATRINLPLDDDWWLLDEASIILMRFTPAGEIDSKTLITDPSTVATYQRWRDVAISHATPAETTTTI